MPIPKPKSEETKEEFIDRCMSDTVMVDEYGDNNQRLAVCNQAWTDKEQKSKSNDIEKRTFIVPINIEKRDDGLEHIYGHAAVFNQEADLGFMREKILPGAFIETIRDDDIVALFNHDTNIVLGRKRSNTLTLNEDEKGLHIKILPPDTQQARDIKTLIKRGDISQMSIAFTTKVEEWQENEDVREPDLRILKKVRLYDVSPVTFPAYEGTDVAVRSHDSFKKQKQEQEQIQQQNHDKPKTHNEYKEVDMKRRKLNLRKKKGG